MLRVRLLGGVDLRLGEERLQPLDSARAESLLAYLLLHRDAPQQRQHLAFTLWPDSTESQARTNLRHVLHNLRRALPEADRFVDAGPRTLQWRPDAPLSLDVDAFKHALDEGRLEDAVGIYSGELLEGNYDEWLFEERERLSQLYRGALERLAEELETHGRVAEATRYAERLLRQDPLREETYRLLIGLYDASGDRAAALRTYHACATTLVRELGVEPSAATREAYDALLGAVPVSEEDLAPASPARPPLVGRRAERERLAALWRDADAGRAHLALVTGEAGIGKSRLVEELRSWCAHRGAAIAESRSYPAEGTMAYGALVAWLRSEPIARRLRRLAPAQLTELARLLPELLSEVPGLAVPERLGEDEQRQRLFVAACRAILSAGAPLLLVAEDLQWCDLQTLQFVHYLLRAEPEARVVVTATARPEELEARRSVRELVAALRALGVVAEIGLERLSRDETALLAEGVADRQLTDDDAERLYQDSEGVPLFVVEALRAEPEAAAPAVEMSERVRAVIASRLALLSEPAAGLVGVAATIGREFTVEVLADASQASEEALLRGLDELWRRAIVRARGPSSYDFTHGKVREAAYGALSPEAARHHHLRVAEALQRSPAQELEAASDRIASHYEAAGKIEDAIAWLARAADAAQRLHASAEAVEALERALRQSRRLPAGGERDALELRLLTQLPAPLVAVEGYLSSRVVDAHERALELARRLGVEPEPPLARSLAMATLTRGEFEAARPFGEQLRARAGRDRDEVLWIESAYVLGI
jgi:DNA-binding SARP family transcriptional activator